MKKQVLLLLLYYPFLLMGQANWKGLAEEANKKYVANDFFTALKGYQVVYQICILDEQTAHSDCIALLNKCGRAYLHLSQFVEADSVFNLSLHLQVQEKHVANKVAAFVGRGNMFFLMGKTDSAVNCYQQAINVCKAAKDSTSADYAEIFRYLGELYQRKSAYKTAENYYLEAAKMMRSYHQDMADYPYIYSCLGNLKGEMGDYPAAEIFYQKAITIWENKTDANQDENYGHVLGRYGQLLLRMGNIAKATQFAQQGLQVLQGIAGDTSTIMLRPYSNIAKLYAIKKDFVQAEIYNQKVARICQKLPKTETNYIYSMYGVALLEVEMANYLKAEPLLKECLSVVEKTNANSTIHAYILADLGRVGHYLQLKKETYSYYTQAIHIVKHLETRKDNDDYISLCFEYAQILWEDSEMDLAESFMTEAISTIFSQTSYLETYLTEKEMELFWQKKGLSYLAKAEQFYVERYASNPNITATHYNKLLNTKAVLLSSIIQNKKRILESKDSTLIQQYEQWQESKKRLANMKMLSLERQEKQKGEIEALSIEVEALEKQLNQHSQAFAKIVNDKEYDWKIVQSVLKKKEAAIEISRFKIYDKTSKQPMDSVCYVALIITKNCVSPKQVLLPNGKALENQIYTNYQKAIENQTSNNAAYKAFLAPILKELGDAKTLYFSADGIYHTLNVNLLQDERGKYVLEKYDIHLVYSTREVIEKAPNLSKIPNPQAVLMGNPTFDLDKQKWASQTTTQPLTAYNMQENSHKSHTRHGFEPLPYAEKEVNEIATLCQNHKWQVATYLRAIATEEVLNSMQSPHILHIATHGYVENIENNENPMLHAGLYFAGAKTFVEDTTEGNYTHDDGILSAYEAANLPLENTNLVVLSACETALGVVRNGEGVYGLQRGFKIAGAKSLLMTLWQVPDAPTQAFMKVFYQELLSGKTTQAALKASQKNAMKHKVPIKYWGAFVLIGR